MDGSQRTSLTRYLRSLVNVLRRVFKHQWRWCRHPFHFTKQGQTTLRPSDIFPASNNVAEYEACLHGIRLAVELGVKCLYVCGDSALVIN
jgi:hypothetical protein